MTCQRETLHGDSMICSVQNVLIHTDIIQLDRLALFFLGQTRALVQ
jgi:hypothetical protein